jgi:Regulator of G protein signaling domain
MTVTVQSTDPSLKKPTIHVSALVGGRNKLNSLQNDRSNHTVSSTSIYSHDSFLTVLHPPCIYDAFATFLQSEHSSENLKFWSRCEKYRHLNQDMSQIVSSIDGKHLQEGSVENINVSHRARVKGIHRANSMILALQEAQGILNDLQKEVEMLMWRDPRFLKYYLSYNASKSLEWYPGKTDTFKGLRECFCLIDPQYVSREILIIVVRTIQLHFVPMHSDMQVTAYPLRQIINHNCRFLQGSLSNRITINRIRDAIKERQESTDVFLDYRNDGTPFWNLLLDIGTSVLD